mgnify:CR=1 FL=1
MPGLPGRWRSKSGASSSPRTFTRRCPYAVLFFTYKNSAYVQVSIEDRLIKAGSVDPIATVAQTRPRAHSLSHTLVKPYIPNLQSISHRLQRFALAPASSHLTVAASHQGWVAALRYAKICFSGLLAYARCGALEHERWSAGCCEYRSVDWTTSVLSVLFDAGVWLHYIMSCPSIACCLLDSAAYSTRHPAPRFEPGSKSQAPAPRQRKRLQTPPHSSLVVCVVERLMI